MIILLDRKVNDYISRKPPYIGWVSHPEAMTGHCLRRTSTEGYLADSIELKIKRALVEN